MSIATTRTLNLALFAAGVAESGKSTYVRELAADWLERGGWVFVHDPTRSFGVPTFATWDDYLAAAAANLDEATGLTRLRICAFTCKWSELVAGLKALARVLNSEHSVRMPILLVADEASSIDTSGRTHMGDADQELFGQRRHFGIAIAVNLQRVTDLMEGFWGRLTDLILCRLGSPVDAQIIERGAELPKGMLAQATSIPQYDFWHIVRGFTNGFSQNRLWEVPP